MSALDTFEPHRAALFGHCYRMLGSSADAEDAVQDTLLRAWRKQASFEGRSEMKTWLHSIATRVCLDRLRGRARRELPVAMGPVGTVEDELVDRPRTHWLEPVPEDRALPVEACPEHRLAFRQSLRLAFVAALQALPARQRAALLLKDVLGFSVEEVAETLGTSPAGVNSALQRARRTLAELDPNPVDAASLSPTQKELVDRYVDAFHRYDIDELVTLLRADATMSMPPYTLWLQGRLSVATWLLGRGAGCRGSRLVPVAASGAVAFGQYRPDPSGGYRAWSLVVLGLAGDAIDSMTFFLDVGGLFPLFGLDLTHPSSGRSANPENR